MPQEDQAAPIADEPAIVDPQPATDEVEVPEELQDALAELGGDVKGEVSDNPDPFKDTLTKEPENDGSEPNPSDATETPAGETAPNDADPAETPPTDVAGQPEAPSPPEPQTTPPEPTPTLEVVEDPGEFKPSDYSFKVTVDGKEMTVKDEADVEAITDLLEEKPEAISAKDFIKFNRSVSAMDNGIAKEKTDHDAKKAAYDTYTETVEVQEKRIEGINNGINYLEAKNLLPKVDSKLVDAVWKDHPDADGIKERLALLNYMAEENTRRVEAGLEPSFDPIAAYNGMQLEQANNKDTQADAAENDKRKSKGSMVGGNAPNIPSNIPKDSIVGEGGSLDDLYQAAYE